MNQNRLLFNLALLVGVVLLVIAYVRWGGSADAESTGSRAEHAYELILAGCIVWGVVLFMRRQRQQ